MNRNNQDELITDIYRAKLVYQAEMKSPEYQAKGEEDFEFIGKALAAKGYCKATDVAREIFEEIENAHEECIHIDTSTNIGYLLQTKFEHKLAELKKKYTNEHITDKRNQ